MKIYWNYGGGLMVGENVKIKLKSLLGMMICYTGLYKILLRKKAIVVLFHRVDDDLDNNPISVTTNTFNLFCEFFKKYFHVISLGTLLEKLKLGEDIGGHLVITFDDGYKDNHDFVMKELKKKNLPACFFITTESIGSSYIPVWDAECSIETKWMNWKDVQSLHEEGFEIGAHTLNHVDLGIVKGDNAMREILGSKERLEIELKTKIKYFSYPFGGVNQITEENREIVRNLNFVCCPSACKGTVSPYTDPFYMKRTPISNWYRSPYQFIFETIFNKE